MQKQDILSYLKSNQAYFYDNFGIRFVGLFGSFSRDEANENSDIDILYTLEKERKLSLFKYLSVTKQLEDFFRSKVDLVRDETVKPAIRSYIEKDLLYV